MQQRPLFERLVQDDDQTLSGAPLETAIENVRRIATRNKKNPEASLFVFTEGEFREILEQLPEKEAFFLFHFFVNGVRQCELETIWNIAMPDAANEQACNVMARSVARLKRNANKPALEPDTVRVFLEQPFGTWKVPGANKILDREELENRLLKLRETQRKLLRLQFSKGTVSEVDKRSLSLDLSTREELNTEILRAMIQINANAADLERLLRE